MITEKRLREIEIRCEKAQGGPWEFCVIKKSGNESMPFIITDKEEINLLGATYTDCDFISNSKQDIPELIAEIRLLKKELINLKDSQYKVNRGI